MENKKNKKGFDWSNWGNFGEEVISEFGERPQKDYLYIMTRRVSKKTITKDDDFIMIWGEIWHKYLIFKMSVIADLEMKKKYYEKQISQNSPVKKLDGIDYNLLYSFSKEFLHFLILKKHFSESLELLIEKLEKDNKEKISTFGNIVKINLFDKEIKLLKKEMGEHLKKIGGDIIKDNETNLYFSELESIGETMKNEDIFHFENFEDDSFISKIKRVITYSYLIVCRDENFLNAFFYKENKDDVVEKYNNKYDKQVLENTKVLMEEIDRIDKIEDETKKNYKEIRKNLFRNNISEEETQENLVKIIKIFEKALEEASLDNYKKKVEESISVLEKSEKNYNDNHIYTIPIIVITFIFISSFFNSFRFNWWNRFFNRD